MSASVKEVEQAFNVAKSIENMEKEAALRFGPRVQVRFDPEFPVEKLVAPNEANYRFAEGMTVAGVTLKSDLRNIAGMAEEIRAIRGITNPLVASERQDGTVHLKQGFRRYGGVQLIRKEEPGSPLANKLANIPVIIYTGLTPEQEKLLINDQTSKRFSRAEVFNIFLQEMRGGYHWLNICDRNYRQIAEVTGGQDTAREIDNISDPDKRKERLREWLNSYVYQGWVSAIKSGPKLTNLWLQTYLWQDGFQGVQRPDVVMDSIRQRALWSEILKDQTAGEWKAVEGEGPRMLKLLNEYKEKDATGYDENGNKIKKVRDPKADRLKNLKEVQDLIKTEEKGGEPTLLSRVYRITLKDGGDPEATRLIRNLDKCRTVFLQHRAYLKPGVQAVCDMLLDGNEGTSETFAALLMDNYVSDEGTPVVTPEPVVETPVAEMPPAPVAETPTASEPEGETAPEPPVTPEPTSESEDDGSYSLSEGATNLPDGGDEHKGKARKPKAKHKAAK